MLKSAFTTDKIEVGLDEVGRGCLAGPVVAAAVILPKDYQHEWLDDSKKLNKEKRTALEEQIKENAIEWAVAEVDNDKIDEINILHASFLAMHHALDQLNTIPELLLVDGNRFKPYHDIPFECMIKGDGKYLSIAAASILAKNYRDRLMASLALTYPHYGWERNVGYPTVAHREGIKAFGITPLHRKSFQLLPSQIELF